MIIIVFAFLLGDIVDLNQHQLHVMLLEAAKLQEAPEDFLGNIFVRICEEMYNKCYFLLQLYQPECRCCHTPIKKICLNSV